MLCAAVVTVSTAVHVASQTVATRRDRARSVLRQFRYDSALSIYTTMRVFLGCELLNVLSALEMLHDCALQKFTIDIDVNNNNNNRDGGLGVRRVSSLALPAFLASAASTQSLQDDILTDCVQSESNFLQ